MLDRYEEVMFSWAIFLKFALPLFRVCVLGDHGITATGLNIQKEEEGLGCELGLVLDF